MTVKSLMLLACPLVALTSGCATPIKVRAAPVCDAARVIGYVGQRYTPDLGKTIRERSESRAARLIAPDTMVTQDLRPDRVNIATDDTGIVTRIYCG